jgi:hypothetical protein
MWDGPSSYVLTKLLSHFYPFWLHDLWWCRVVSTSYQLNTRNNCCAKFYSSMNLPFQPMSAGWGQSEGRSRGSVVLEGRRSKTYNNYSRRCQDAYFSQCQSLTSPRWRPAQSRPWTGCVPRRRESVLSLPKLRCPKSFMKTQQVFSQKRRLTNSSYLIYKKTSSGQRCARSVALMT